ncbi:MAG TPA: c-type cytochrome [Chitinophagaceae bacterium]
MNGQVNYIVHATLLLLVAGGTILFFRTLPSSLIASKQEEAWCGTVDQTKNVSLSENASKGKTLFMSKCASCHNLFKHTTGPALSGFEDRGRWADRQNVYEWIKNPATFMKKDPYTRKLREEY